MSSSFDLEHVHKERKNSSDVRNYLIKAWLTYRNTRIRKKIVQLEKQAEENGILMADIPGSQEEITSFPRSKKKKKNPFEELANP